ncbi:hypothetical protein O3M35_009541 [Rhynocoris fuscipes]|uniref:Uncharacterized protein n=1 Tax=Rhynocoris fuscipes TaxID=488301 RepID=A0AAW1DAV9_9HEMI
MDSAQNAVLFRKRDKDTKDGLKKQTDEPLDWTKYKWNIDIERAESQADMKLLADSLSDLSNKDEEMKDIIDNVTKNIETRKQCEEHEQHLDEEMLRSSERLRRFKEILEKVKNDNFQTKKIKEHTMDEIDNMTTEQLDEKLQELCKAMEELRVAREGPGCIPEVRASLEKYQKLIKGALNIRPKRPDHLKMYSSDPKKKSVRDLLLQGAHKINVNEELSDKIDKLPRGEMEAELALNYLKEMANEKNIPNKDLPTFIKSVLMPDFHA